MTAHDRGIVQRVALALLVVLAVGLPLPAARPKRRKAKPAMPVIRLLDGFHYSLADAKEAQSGQKFLSFKIMLSGGGKKYWVSESCNPVLPVLNGKPVALKQCFTNFYSHGVLDHGKGELMTFDWPLNSPDALLKAGGSYHLAVVLATDCTRSGGPGLFALGDCKTTMTMQSPPFFVTE